MGKTEESLRDHERSVSLNANDTFSTTFLLSYYSERNDFPKIRGILEQVLEKTKSPMKSERILLQLISISKAEKNDALIKKYTQMRIDVQRKMQNDPIIKIGNFLNKYLGEPDS